MEKRDWLKYGGDTAQFFGVRESRVTGGKADGMRICDVHTAAGMTFEVLPDRCMDIRRLCLNGVNMAYLSNAGMVSPSLCERDGIGFLRGFSAGFLTTCGLRNVGSPCSENGEDFGLHGRIGSTPADSFSSRTCWHDGKPELVLSGEMRESRVFGENLVLRREMRIAGDGTRIILSDTVENEGFRDEDFMLLYHFNLGHPLLDADATLLLPSRDILPRDEEAARGIATSQAMQPPTPGYSEQVFYHKLNANPEGWTLAALLNHRLEKGVSIRFRGGQLGNFTQWKQMGTGEYVLGLEPCNSPVGGRVSAREQGRLECLKAGEVRRFDLQIDLLSGGSELDGITAEWERLRR